MATQQSDADKAAAEQQKREAADAKMRADAKQDTSKVAPMEYGLNPANIDGLRPATDTPPQIVEAAPGVELDKDLDRAAVQRAETKAALAKLEGKDADSDDLLTRAQAKAPNLTSEFVSQYGLTDSDLEEIANGSVPPPPTVGPIHNVDLHRTPGGWQITPVGVPVEDTNKNAINR